MLTGRKPSRKQSTISWMALGILALITVWLWQAQSTKNPALQSLPALPDGGTAPAGPGGNLDLAALLPPELTVLSPAEHFNADTLADKINGKAELYLASGFQGLTAQRFQLAGQEDSWLEAFVYDQGDMAGAFAVYSQQRRPGAKSADLGAFSYASRNGLFLVHGPYYLEIIAAQPAPALLAAGRALAGNFVHRTRVEEQSIPELALFPAQGLANDTLSYLAKDAFGFALADRFYVADYSGAGSPLTAFISRRSSPQEAADLAKRFVEFWAQQGGKALPAPTEAPRARVVDLYGISEVIFNQGAYVAGVHQAEDLPAALELAGRLRAGLEKAAP